MHSCGIQIFYRLSYFNNQVHLLIHVFLPHIQTMLYRDKTIMESALSMHGFSVTFIRGICFKPHIALDFLNK